MKVCPTCKETYKDDDLNFCLADGATLVKKRGGVTVRHSRVNEIVAVILLALSVLIFLCLISYNTSDPTFNTASSQKVQNWIGVVGANVAEALFSAVGIVAYIFPALLALIAWRVFQSEDLKPRISQIIGFTLVVASVSAIANLIGWHGGLLGALLATYSVRLLSVVGGAIFLIALATTSVLMISNFTLAWAFSHLELAWGNMMIHYAGWKAKRREARSGEINLAKERSEKRRGAREERGLKESPTISIPESRKTKASKSVELAAAAAAGAGQNPFETAPDFADESPPPSIVPPEAVPDTVMESFPSEPGSIPITPTKHTDDLNGDLAASTADVEESGLPMTSTKSYDDYVLPGTPLLTESDPHIEQKEKVLLAIADSLVEKTREFNVAGKVVNICPGPVVTTYEFKPDPGVKYSRVTGLVDDLCLALKAESVRIDRIPGKAFVGIEVPNQKRETIRLRDVVESKKFRESDSLLTIALGKTIDGLNYVADLAKMPHLLIAGATGAGKSVGVNSLIVSILYKAKPDEVKFIMVDPKRLELGVYADIPHLATPIITDPKRAATSLKWAVIEMERRYKDLAGYGVRNIDGYNTEARRRNSLEMWDDTGEPHRILPYIVIIIDELADLMMVSGKEVEESITRLAQMARAVGIHLVLATQRPSVDVITGLIKANFPARISFRVSSKVDSRTIIDSNGAEGLLGKGDMLFLPPACSQVLRVHGAFVDEKEIAKIVDHIKAQGKPEYDTTITKSDDESDESGDLPGRRDPLFWDALKCVVNAKRGSTSLLQRHLRIGYGRAAAILDAMVKEGYIGDMDGSTRARPVLSKAYEDLQDLAEMGDQV
jgi:S-DNA-T family DNA segregation ATPase FtsK/SpoIIIE